MDKDQILAQMGVTQWRLRQPIERNTAAPEQVNRATEATVPVQEKGLSPKLIPEPTRKIAPPVTQPLTPVLEAAPSFDVSAVTVSANVASAAAGLNWVFVLANDVEEDAQQSRLFNNILKAIDFFSLAPVQYEDRAIWLQGLQSSGINLILLMGEAATKMAFPDKAAMSLYKLLPQQTGPTITPVLALPSLAQLIEQPKLKRDVWGALQEAINLSQ
ncbi:MAG: hypothetical protein ACI9J2_001894 [Saprospiraceae bacterium]|jgi:hypothetical protein